MESSVYRSQETRKGQEDHRGFKGKGKNTCTVKVEREGSKIPSNEQL